MEQWPRRSRLDLNTPAEKAIRDAMTEVEKLPASEDQTLTIILLQRAFDKVADIEDLTHGKFA